MKMSANYRLIILALLVLITGCSEGPIGPAQPNSIFDGTWKTMDDKDSTSVAWITIKTAGKSIFVRSTGYASAGDYGWQEESTDLRDALDSTLVVAFTSYSVVRAQSITMLDNGRLKVDTHTHYLSDNAKPDWDSSDLLYRYGD